MDVAILFSGGKDSAYAIEYARSRDWQIKYLLTIIPTRKDCYLFHYATTENAAKIAEMLGLKHLTLKCNFANPLKEALLVKELVERNKVDALILGGVGLQETQIKSLQDAMLPLGIEVFASHAGYSHEELMKEMLQKGYRFIISQIASDGLHDWLGKEITKENFQQLQKDAVKYGFHIGFEGGYAETLCIDAPYFPQSLEILEAEKIFDDEYSGHIVIKTMQFVDKEKELKKEEL